MLPILLLVISVCGEPITTILPYPGYVMTTWSNCVKYDCTFRPMRGDGTDWCYPNVHVDTNFTSNRSVSFYVSFESLPCRDPYSSPLVYYPHWSHWNVTQLTAHEVELDHEQGCVVIRNDGNGSTLLNYDLSVWCAGTSLCPPPILLLIPLLYILFWEHSNVAQSTP